MSVQVPHQTQNMTTRELTAQLGDQLTRLVRDEIALARAELFAAARQAALSGGMLTAAMVAGLTCWLAMVTAAIAGIAAGLPIWASALIVGGVSGVSAGLLALLGVRRLRRGNPPLQLTVGSIREELTDLATRARTRQ